MRPLSRVAIVGAGAAGLTAGIRLATAGVDVELFERRTEPESGSGITLQANALRVLRGLGVLEEVLASGFGFDTTAIRTPDPSARVVAVLHEDRAPDGVPSTAGIRRAALTGILERRAIDAGVRIRRGDEVVGIDEQADAVTPLLGNGRLAEPVDLVIGADGVRSRIRSMIGIEARADALPLSVWRVLVPRPAALERMEIINGGVAKLAGIVPCGPDVAYAWLTEDARERREETQDEQRAAFAEVARHYGGAWPDVVATLGPDTPVNYTRYTRLLVEAPWHRGRVVVIGDAVHSCPPTMAQGAAMSLEDGEVLADELVARGLDDPTLEAVVARRMPRIRAVVDGSMAIMDQQLGGPRIDVPELMARTTALLAEPA